jgi:hypothetical protein
MKTLLVAMVLVAACVAVATLAHGPARGVCFDHNEWIKSKGSSSQTWREAARCSKRIFTQRRRRILHSPDPLPVGQAPLTRTSLTGLSQIPSLHTPHRAKPCTRGDRSKRPTKPSTNIRRGKFP